MTSHGECPTVLRVVSLAFVDDRSWMKCARYLEDGGKWLIVQENRPSARRRTLREAGRRKAPSSRVDAMQRLLSVMCYRSENPLRIDSQQPCFAKHDESYNIASEDRSNVGIAEDY